MTPDPQALLPVALQAAVQANQMMRTRRPGTITEKQDRDLVSDIDVAIERAIRAHLAEATPGVEFLGEEEGHTGASGTGWMWALDPIDGTSNFAHGIPLCAMSLALVRDGEPMLAVIDAPFLGQRYHAIAGQGAYTGSTRLSASSTTRLHDAIVAVGDYATGPGADRQNETRLAITIQLTPRVHRIRMLGTAALDLVWVAQGRLDASVILGSKPWDTAAGVLIAREAGATVTDIHGTRHTFGSTTTITAPPALISQLVPLLQAADATSATTQTSPARQTLPYAALDSILSHARYLIFEFDGPVCDLSAALPDDTADRLTAIVATGTAETLPRTVRADGPFAILTHAAAISPQLAAHADAELTAIETTAATKATPAGYIHETIAACCDSGRTPAIVSHHAGQAVRAFLHQYGLADQIRHVTAPGTYPPGHLQTTPHLIRDTIRALGATPDECAVITPSPTTLRAVRATGAHPISYRHAPSTGNQAPATEGDTALIPSLADLTLRLRARPLPN